MRLVSVGVPVPFLDLLTYQVPDGVSTPPRGARVVVPLGNRVRVRIGPFVAEITATSADRLGLERGSAVVASFKASATKLVPIALDGPGRPQR